METIEKLRILLVHSEPAVREEVRQRLVAAGGFEVLGEESPVGAMPHLVLAEFQAPVKETAVLTARERQVLTLTAEGGSAREIAAALEVSVKTVEAHKVNLMRKLNIHNRAHLVRYALESGVGLRPGR